MAQNPIVVPDGSGFQVRTGFNNALLSLATLFAGTGAPNPLYPYQFWINTSTNEIMQADKNGVNSYELGTIDANGTIHWLTSGFSGVLPIVNGGTGLSSTLAYSVLSNNTSTPSVLASNETLVLGTPEITDTGILIQATSSTPMYNQILIQNINSGTTASTNFIVNNDQGTASTYYGEFGMNSSGFTGPSAFNTPNMVYLEAVSGDLAIGTGTANAIHFVTNAGAADSATISSAGVLSLATPLPLGSGGTNATSAASALVNLFPSAVQGNIPYYNGTAWVNLATGTAGQVLQTQDSGANPVWSNGPTTDRNKIINGDNRFDQLNSGSSQTITAGAALAYTNDRWFVYCTGANVTGQRVTSGVNNFQYAYQITGASSVTAVVRGQRIESFNAYDLAGNTATLQAQISSTTLTSITWTAYYANTTDTFGTVASPTKTQIATGTFTITSTPTKYTVNISMPANAINGVEIDFSVGAFTSGTLTITGVQLEKNSYATPFEFLSYGAELALCERYAYMLITYWLGYTMSASNLYNGIVIYPVTMRTTPTLLNATFTVGSGNAGTPAITTDTTTQMAALSNSAANWSTGVFCYIGGYLSAEL